MKSWNQNNFWDNFIIHLNYFKLHGFLYSTILSCSLYDLNYINFILIHTFMAVKRNKKWNVRKNKQTRIHYFYKHIHIYIISSSNFFFLKLTHPLSLSHHKRTESIKRWNFVVHKLWVFKFGPGCVVGGRDRLPWPAESIPGAVCDVSRVFFSLGCDVLARSSQDRPTLLAFCSSSVEEGH